MENLSFYPFNKNLDEVILDDLIQLRQIAEGWYVEYKRTVVPARSIAKSLAAFANHYGGWIFYGIEGARDGSNVASNYPGLDKSETSQLVQNLRNAAKDLINPSPYYDYKVLEGPWDEINLPTDRSVVIVVVPSGIDTPYIHGDGRIYRRIADASDPKAETDRFILDQLWEKKKKAEKKLASFIKKEPIISEVEKENTFMHLFLLQNPSTPVVKESSLIFDDFTRIMSIASSSEESFSMSYDNFFTMGNGFIARHVYNNNPYNLVTTWKYNIDGSSVITIPIRKYNDYSKFAIVGQRGYKHINTYIQILKSQKHDHIDIIDVQMIILSILTCITRQYTLNKQGDVSRNIYAKARLCNIWRCTPYLDTSVYMDFINTNGIPVIQNNKQFAPIGTNFDSFIPIDEGEVSEGDPLAVVQFSQALPILIHIGNILGIPKKVLFNEDGEWYSAIARSIGVLGDKDAQQYQQ